MKIGFELPGVGIYDETRVVFEYATRLSERGHDVAVLSPVVPQSWTKDCFPPGRDSPKP